jgi:hypothetical protein
MMKYPNPLPTFTPNLAGANPECFVGARPACVVGALAAYNYGGDDLVQPSAGCKSPAFTPDLAGANPECFVGAGHARDQLKVRGHGPLLHRCNL